MNTLAPGKPLLASAVPRDSDWDVPMLSSSAQRLLSAADDSVRLNISFLELVAVKDPVAVCKLLALANSAYVSRPRAVQRVRDAIQLLGADLSYQVLLQSAILATLAETRALVSTGQSDYLRAYMLSMTLTMRQLCKNVDASFTPSVESLSSFSALGVVAGLFSKQQCPLAAKCLARQAEVGDFRIHLHPDLRDWVGLTPRVLRHWRFDETALLTVSRISSELCAHYDGEIPGAEVSPDTALAACAQWLLTHDVESTEGQRQWGELGVAQRCGFPQTRVPPATLRVLLK